MKRRLLVVTSVHPSDDPRVRHKFIGTLAQDFDIVYATKSPGPSDTHGFTWRRLKGGRLGRWFASLVAMLTVPADVILVHDPELIPAAIVAKLVRRKPVVFDLHENVAAQILTKSAIPGVLRRPLAAGAMAWIRIAERLIDLTLAEEGYRDLLRSDPPVFPNYPDVALLPEPLSTTRDGIVYVGDVTEQRGAVTLLEAAAQAGVGPVIYVGRCADVLRRELLERASELGVRVEMKGWQPYPAAMAIAGSATVGVSPLHDTPNYRASLPTKTLEYLALGTPVVATDLPGTSKVIGELPGVVLVQPGSATHLSEALGSVDGSVAAQALEGASAVRRDYRWPAVEVRAFYASLAER